MDVMQAKKAGVAAHREGRGRAPALNQQFIREACASPVSTAELLAAYIHGWTVAMLAVGAQDALTPSLQELATIEASVDRPARS